MDLRKSVLKAFKPVLVAALLAGGAAFADADFAKGVQGLPPSVMILLPVLQLLAHTALDGYKHRNDGEGK